MKTLIKDFLAIFSTLLVMWTGLIATFIFFLSETSWYVGVPCVFLSMLVLGPSYFFWREKFDNVMKNKSKA